MHLISKTKDYYDFVARNDKDSKIVYNRKFTQFDSKLPGGKKLKFDLSLNETYSSYEIPNEYGKFIFLSFCDMNYNIFRTSDGEFIYTFDEFKEKIDPKEKLKFTIEYFKRYKDWRQTELFRPFTPEKTENNKLTNCPVLVKFPLITDLKWHGTYLNPILSEISFGKIMSPIACYQEIYNWLSAQKPEIKVPDSPDDMSRYEAKGFSKKTSFRKM